MSPGTLQTFIHDAREAWAPFHTRTVLHIADLVGDLLKKAHNAPWCQKLQNHPSPRTLLHADPECGFQLLAHSAPQGHYRPPHNHGLGWVIYGVLRGEISIGTYAHIQGGEAPSMLVQRNAQVLQEGEHRTFLPGDIHDIQCLSESSLVLRFTSCDLSKERQTGRLKVYPKPTPSQTR